MDFNAKKVALITGATGFVGFHLSMALVNNGWDVHVIVRSRSSEDSVTRLKNKNIKIHYYNPSQNNMNEIVNEARPTIVFHLASLFLSQHTHSDIGELINSNILLGTQLADAMVSQGIYNLINTGTSWQHYNNENYNPVCLYAATKQAFESVLTFYQETTPLHVITLKLFDTYGPNDKRNKLFTLLKRTAENNEQLDMSAGDQLIDLVYIEDVVDAFVLSADYLLSGQFDYCGTFAVTSQKPVSLKEVVHIYEEVCKKKLNINWGARPYRNREVMVPWNKGNILPNWKAAVQLEEGIRKLLTHN